MRTTGVGGSDDLTPDTQPDPQKPDKPGKIVIDPPRDTNGGNRSDAKFNKSVKIGKAKAGVSSRSSSSMPR